MHCWENPCPVSAKDSASEVVDIWFLKHYYDHSLPCEFTAANEVMMTVMQLINILLPDLKGILFSLPGVGWNGCA